MVITGSRGTLAPALERVPEAHKRTLALPASSSAAEHLFDREPMLFAGFGLDATPEAALKIKEGGYLWGGQEERAGLDDRMAAEAELRVRHDPPRRPAPSAAARQ